MRKTVALTLAMLMFAVALVPVPVSAQGPGGGGVVVPINTVDFLGNLTLRSFSVVNGVLTAFGTVSGTALTGANAGTTFVRQVALPVTDLQQGATCDILNLVLGPLRLDLLGLIVEIPAPIVINIFAEQGPGNLLGNLLCAITGLLDPGPALATNLQQLTAFLNRLLGQL